MLTLLMIADYDKEDLADKHLEILNTVSKLEKSFEVLFLAKTTFKALDTLRYISSSTINHYLIVSDHKTSDDEMVQMGLELAGGNDILLCTLSSKPEVIKEILEKKNDDRKIVYVRRKTNKFKDFFRKIGIWSYNIGLKFLGKNYDNFAEVRLAYFDGRIGETLAGCIKNNREKRITNSFKDVRTGVVEENTLYFDESKKTYKENNMFGLGFISFFYIIALLALLVIYPCFHNMTYSWWMVVIIFAWVLFGILAIIVTSRKIYFSRCGPPPRVNEIGEPLYGIVEKVEYGDEVTLPPVKEKQTKIEKPVIKNKMKVLQVTSKKVETKKDIKKYNLPKKAIIKKVKNLKEN